MKLSLIVPVYNEEKALPIFYKKIRGGGYFDNLEVELVFVNDGSSDATEEILNSLSISDPLVKSLSFTRNFGKEAAVCAGLDHASGDAVIPMDVDLQDPIEVVPKLIEKWKEGAEIVLAKRKDRPGDSFLKKTLAINFYKFLNAISYPKIERNVGDFRLLSRNVVEEVKLLPERNLFMRGLLSWPGGKTEIVEYTRVERSVDTTKYSNWKSWMLALEGIRSFSTFPIRIWSYIGLVVAGFAFLLGLWIIVEKLLFGLPVSGYASLMVSILFLGGVQLIGIGVLGEYIGGIYTEVKQRPRYILKKSKSTDKSV